MRPGRRHLLRRPGPSPAWTAGMPGAIQDRDLRRRALPRSRGFNAAPALLPFGFAAWDGLARDPDGGDNGRLEEPAGRGTTIVAYRATQVRRLCDAAFWADVVGHRVPVVNSPLLASEVGAELCRRHPEAPFAAVFCLVSVTEESWSLRSRGDFDVGALARSLGGGGHRAAAGFQVLRRGAERP